MKRRFLICFMMLAMFTVMVNAEMITITIVDGVSGNDGASTVGSSSAPDTTSNGLGLGWPSWGWQEVAQTYYKIPDALKSPGVTIISATLQMQTKYCTDGAPASYNANTVDGYGGMYFQLMHYTYDTGDVTVANGNATENSANYTRVGTQHFQSATDNSTHYWDVTSLLQADIAAGWTYSPYVTRLTYSDGTLCESPFGPEGYYGSIWSSNSSQYEEPRIVVEYFAPCASSIGLLRGVNGDTVEEYGEDPAAPGHIIINGFNSTDTGNVNALEFVADMQSAQDITAFGIKNRAVKTGLNPSMAKIYVAPDESAVGFNPQDANCFTQQINVFTPYAVDFESNVSDANLNDGNLIRWINVTPVNRRYVKFEITEIDNGPFSTTYQLAQWQDVLSSTTLQGLPSAGSLMGLGDDEVGVGRDTYGYDYIVFSDWDGSMTADAVIDLTAVKDIQKIRNINGIAVDTLFNIKNVKMYVTPISGAGSENEAGFDPLEKSNYTMEIFNGSFYPGSYSAGVERIADVTDVSRRYVMLEISSNYWGNLGDTIEGPGYNYYVTTADFEVLGTDSITKCSDVIALGLALSGDLNKDCQINIADAELMVDEWLKCTAPDGIGCTEYTNHPTFQIPKGSGITINGNLSDWPADSEWIWLNKVYFGFPPFDVSDARMSLRWGDDNRIYVAVVVTDSNHTFIDAPDALYTGSDGIEIYSQGCGAAGGTDWGAESTNKYFDVAQQYIVGPKTLSTGGHWAVWGDLTNVDPAALASAVVVNGNQIIYEAAVKQYNNYGGKGGGETVVTPLAVGTTVGFDVTVETRYSNNTSFGMLAENDFTGKSVDADQFRLYDLVQTVRAKTCGEWGYLPADLVPDCIVNLADFATFAEKWMQCNDPVNEENCVHNW